MTASVEQAVAAAVAVARQHGLPVEVPALLSWGVNAVVHLRPAPVVARVAVYTPLLRPEIRRPFTRELALAAALTAAGAAVVPPSDLLPPGPHEHDGLTVSFWRHVDVSPDRPTAEQAGRSLAELHEVLGTLPPLWTGSPLDRPLEDLAVFRDTGTELGADPAVLREVGELVTALRPRLVGAEMTLHGDTHPGNLLVTGEGLRWTDLEDTSRGPRAWDLASLRCSARLDGRAALDAMPDPVSEAELAPFVWLRRLYAGAWWFVHAAREPADLPEARRRLAAAVSEVGAGLR
ncbi:phosphotransferase [Modestobacter sp. VKM Ac-2978]|uniref:phosphotransferase n=1 Tax=Modestobacter sp. VKM Ac-2978 TaxID=3004132 RepID=UPI0022AB458B|nr:phosphotransferase [Modestobacter sp. VKM Ac-2978]MCZ2846946.1 phosphotransferase [Modestobacter sp. VKM Ac-2978]